MNGLIFYHQVSQFSIPLPLWDTIVATWDWSDGLCVDLTKTLEPIRRHSRIVSYPTLDAVFKKYPDEHYVFLLPQGKILPSTKPYFLHEYIHPDNAFYVIGPDSGIHERESLKVKSRDIVTIGTPTLGNNGTMLWSAEAAIVLSYDRWFKKCQ